MVKGSVSQKVRERDRAIYERICERVHQEGRFPTVRELMADLHISSSSMVEASLVRLEAQGLLLREGHRRSLPGYTGSVPVPVLGTIAAGEPLMAAEHIEGYIQVRPELAQHRELFALKVRGDSMINAGILENDTVILARTSTVENGEIAAVWLEDAATVKRFYREKGQIRLQPENDRLEPIYTKDCTILGKVIGLVRSYE
ncbi:MAG: repressor LexA [Clostridia bacterium]|nr:repressor LexA [Clostridia bacterium]